MEQKTVAKSAGLAGLQRYLVNRESGDVWIWTERLAEAYPGFAEVFARNPEDAKIKRAMPDARTVSLAQLEEMTKADLVLFSAIKLDPPIATQDELAKLDKPDLLDLVKEAIFTRGGGERPAQP